MAEYNEDFDGIRVTEVNQRENSWTFLVELGHGDNLVECYVEVNRDYWTQLTSRRVEPAGLIEATFKFLLEKTPKEMIMKKFNLNDIIRLYPQYENEIKRIL
ncbi:MAG: hypothetical protein A3B86_03480 [Candidatus Yanofskybacteria bacterium RIFCSPHIGHO2_02_FULL_38_22b]|uniref:Uncharacterized protein n=1 Tax=Candidatus Yanofskybacteria bacterium RIFCSPHIGHO2_02_FULL_38_22b TaxID=1802673 RepID=A0A1F8F026_9BACT|nr:MAG: hypothetical protein A3B86_03480 [Candidatus Yanofskybacteria bacterium RIFCSPHIGHO2_02_FULL_38_22b]OGN19446.1 MAG: hypothetical protein A2910_02860 [Candidatus Yanofskybacteria bacterium RIFCSPLOWO2_01_FULL_39_28]